MFKWYRKLSQLNDNIEYWKEDRRNARVSSMAVNPRHFYIHRKESTPVASGYYAPTAFVMGSVFIPTSIIWIVTSVANIYIQVSMAESVVNEENGWSESPVTSIGQTVMEAIPHLLFGLLFLGLGLFMLRIYSTKYHLLTDAQVLNEFGFTPEQWQQRFPRKARKINPDTGNIERKYKHTYKESKAEEKMRFLETVERYKNDSTGKKSLR